MLFDTIAITKQKTIAITKLNCFIELAETLLFNLLLEKERIAAGLRK